MLRARLALESELRHALRRLDDAKRDVERLQARVANLAGDMPTTPVPTKPGPGDRTGIEMKVLEYLRGAGPTAIQTLYDAFPPHNNAVKEALRRLRRKGLVKGGDRSGMYSAPSRAIRLRR